MSCSDPLNLFGEYDGVNLIDGYQFGETDAEGNGWTADHGWGSGFTQTSVNNYMNFEPVTGIDTSSIPAPADGDPVHVYRLEIKNQFINGDFESAGELSNVFYVDPDSGVESSASIESGVDNEIGTGQSVRINTVIDDPIDQYYIDLATRVNTWSDADEYSFHFDFYSYIGSYYFQFDDNTDRPDFLYFSALSERTETVLSFPGNASTEKNNLISADSRYSRWYLGKVDGTVQFDSQLDNIRFVRADTDYAVRLQVPYTHEDSGLELVQNAPYVFTLYVRKDSRAPGANNFYSEILNVTASDIYSGGIGGVTVSQDFDISSIGSSWTKIQMPFDGLVQGVPEDDSAKMIEIAITASGLNKTIDEAGNLSVFPLDAGAVLIAAPSLELGTIE
ncbi:hypothetical protein [Salinispira pacifica]|nr:hypothetical protein [Salinispira pacifica]